MTPVAASKKLSKFDPKTFLSTINGGRKIEPFRKKQTIFTQGDSGDAVFYIKEGKVKLTVVSVRIRFNKTATQGRSRRRGNEKAANPYGLAAFL